MKQRILRSLLISVCVIYSVIFVAEQLPAMEGHAQGKNIHTPKLDVFFLSYQMIDMRENIKKMEGEHAAHMMT